MTTIPELEAKLAELQKQLEELKQQPETSEEIPLKEFLPFEPKEGDDYLTFYATELYGLEIGCDEWEDDLVDEANFLLGTIYRTKRVTETIMGNRITLAKLKVLANFVPDWEDSNQTKCGVGWNFRYDKLILQDWKQSSCCYVYFRTEKEAKAAAEKVGHARIRQLMKYGI